MSENTKMKKTSIGGQALIEGVMMRGPAVTAMAVRHTSGEIVLEDWTTEGADKPKWMKLPFIRGIFNFIDSLRFGYKALMRSAELSGLEELEEEGEMPSWIMNTLMVVSSVLGVAVSVVLFIWLPAFLFRMLSRAVPALDHALIRGVFEGVLRILLFVGYVAVISLMKDIKRVFMYHGAEHK
ncbi:MAG: DUF1385 domain-containing protein, partial [Clostridia bacterium]|nr:DUF1385 domain-containing protein [Clostridia bacterium]